MKILLLRATPPFLLELPLLIDFDDLMPLPVIFGFQFTYKVNDEEGFEKKKRCTKIDTSTSRLIQILIPAFPSLFSLW